ncbi:MAG: holo-[acyl-carrier-protein] synthase [Desulfuromonadales bacterium]|nr:holo-[acyl-carrier-protein] synthase [Desulfuromonadales bacterium]
MIFGIGTDIVDISRFQRFVDNNNTTLLKRLFTEQEQVVCSAKRSSASCYAARFAAKEAFLKALGTGLREGISWLDMEVVNDDLGKPDLCLSGRARELYREKNIKRLFLSLSHDANCAIAMVVLEET